MDFDRLRRAGQTRGRVRIVREATTRHVNANAQVRASQAEVNPAAAAELVEPATGLEAFVYGFTPMTSPFLVLSPDGEVDMIFSRFSETVLASSLVDGGAAIGTKTLSAQIPAGAIVFGVKVSVSAGFAGDVSAVLGMTDGVRTLFSGVNVFAAAAAGVALQLGATVIGRFYAAATSLPITVTSAADITPVLAGGGSLTVTLYYLQT